MTLLQTSAAQRQEAVAAVDLSPPIETAMTHKNSTSAEAGQSTMRRLGDHIIGKHKGRIVVGEIIEVGVGSDGRPFVTIETPDRFYRFPASAAAKFMLVRPNSAMA